MKYSLPEIQQIVGGELIGWQSQVIIENIFFDTRKIAIPRKALFICFTGLKRDGHTYIKDAIQKGIKHFIVEKTPSLELLEKAQFLIINSSLIALQTLAKYHRQQYQNTVIGITGSNGKTIVKEWLYTVLSEKYRVYRSPMSYNSQIGVALSILDIESTHEVAIIEAGIAQVSDMSTLSDMIVCDIGILTNIGDAHQSGFASISEKIDEKFQLFDSAHSLIISEDQSNVWDKAQKNSDKLELISWSNKEGSNIHIKIDQTNSLSTFSINKDGIEENFSTSIRDLHSIQNLCNVIVCAMHLNLTRDAIQQGIYRISESSIRLELKEGSNQNIIIDDSYSFDLISLKSALSFLDRNASTRKKMVILSDLADADEEDSLVENISELLINHNIEIVYHVGAKGDIFQKYLSQAIGFKSFQATEALIGDLLKDGPHQTAILVKGARKFRFENVVKQLVRQKHTTELVVNLTALKHNLNTFVNQLKPSTKILSVVKADAYGTGSYALANFLENAGVDYLAVAYVDEGIELRQKGIKLPILVLNPEMDNVNLLSEYVLEPEIYSIHQLRRFCEYEEVNKAIPIHIKLDTGMNRLGIDFKDADELIDLVVDNEIQVQSIMSHLAAADDPNKDELTVKQLSDFEKMSQYIIERLPNNPDRHILNSAGILRFADYQYDMVRLGKGMYGIDMTSILSDSLERVQSLYACISQIKKVSKGATIGYGGHIKLEEMKRIAIIGIGYADGLPRKIGNGKVSFSVRDTKVPTIGNICMDMCMIDITSNPEIAVGDRVEIFGNEVDILNLAEAADTIPLEILSKLSKRLKKVYSED